MTVVAYICAVWCLALLVLNFSAMFVTARKCRARPRDLPVPVTPPHSTVVAALEAMPDRDAAPAAT